MFRNLACAIVGSAALFVAGLAHGADEIPGWRVAPTGEANSCVAAGPTDRAAQLVLMTNPTENRLLIISPALPAETGDQQVGVSLDHKPIGERPAIGTAHTVSLLVAGSFAQTLAQSSSVTATVAGQSFHFKAPHIGQALDAAARCAHVPTLAEREKSGG